MTIPEIDALLTANGWTEDKAVTHARIAADASGVEAWRHHCRIAGYLQAIGQSLKVSNLNANQYLQDVYARDTRGPPTLLP